MNILHRYVPAAVVLAFASSVALSAEMKQQMTFDRSNLRVLRSRFGTYGYQPRQSVVLEADGVRLGLSADVAGVGQTGMYAYFALAGDCEVTLAYEVLNLQPPTTGYGSGVGLALDAGDDVGRGTIQRLARPGQGDGYVVQVNRARALGGPNEDSRFLPATAERGRLGLRRVNKDLVFLASDGPDSPPREIARLPFTDQLIRGVRFFADPGGSPTAVEVRVVGLTVRAEEVAAGEPRIKKGAHGRRWVWLILPAAAGAALVGWWWLRKGKGGETQAVASKPAGGAKGSPHRCGRG